MSRKHHGRIKHIGHYYAAEIRTLGIATQGRTLDEALAMVRDAIGIVIDDPGICITIEILPRGQFVATLSDAESPARD